MDQLLQKIEGFLDETGMAASAFGRKVLGDPSFVFRIRRGGQCLPSTVEKVERGIQTLSRNEEGA